MPAVPGAPLSDRPTTTQKAQAEVGAPYASGARHNTQRKGRERAVFRQQVLLPRAEPLTRTGVTSLSASLLNPAVVVGPGVSRPTATRRADTELGPSALVGAGCGRIHAVHSGGTVRVGDQPVQ